MSSINLKKEQYQAIYETDGKTVLVSASAGSGKTFVMIERIIHLVREGKLKVDQLLAVTFTDKAAFEMREKLTKALIDAINNGDKKLKEELLNLPMADICTIDAFCSRLVKRYFYELGIERDFEILSDVDKFRLIADATDKVFDDLYKAKDEDFLRLVSRQKKNRSDRPLRELVYRIYSFAGSEPDLEEWLNLTDNVFTKTGLLQLEKDFVAVVEDKINKILRGYTRFEEKARLIDEKCHEYVKKQKEGLSTYLGANSVYEFVGAKVSAFGTLSLPKNSSDEAKALKDEIAKYRTKVNNDLNKLFEKLEDEETTQRKLLATRGDYFTLKRLVLLFAKEYERLKAEENKYEFNDVERFTLKLLQIQEVRDAVAGKYKNIFIDEYQDVNGIQEQIFNLIERDNEFMVGDVKQSIYGFRGCNSKLFSEKYKKLSLTGNTLNLNHNFRSANAVINAVNDIFDNVITEEGFGVDYKQSRLVAGGSYDEGGEGRVKLHIVYPPKKEKEEVNSEVYDIVLDSEKDAVSDDDYTALMVREIIQDELGKEYFDIKTKTMKKVRLSDIAVLCRKKTEPTVSLIKHLSKYGIRVASEVETSALDAKEVKLLVEYLRLLSCFEQDIPLANCMLSEIGGFTVNELAELVSIARKRPVVDKREKSNDLGTTLFLTGYKMALDLMDELGDKVRAFDEYIKECRFLADYYGAHYALEKVLREKNLFAYALVKPLGEERERKIERFLSESISNDKNLSVDEFLYKIDNSVDSFSMTATSSGDAVTIITSHKSKGLEYPVVIAVGLEKNFNMQDTKERVILDRDLGVSLMTYDDENREVSTNLLREYFKWRATTKQCRDEARLFYVTTTRAKYSLHLVSIEKKKATVSAVEQDATRFFDFIPDCIDREERDGLELITNDKKELVSSVVVGDKNIDLIERIKKNLSFKYPYEEDTALTLKTSVTSALATDDNDVEIEKEDYSLYDTIEKTKDGGFRLFEPITTDEGITAHKILEHYDFSDGDFDGQIDKMLSGGVLLEDELKAINLNGIKRALSLDVFEQISNAKLYREQYFVCKVPASKVFSDYVGEEKVLLQGVIDMLAVVDGEAVIIDYKYSAKSREKLLATYKRQLELYKLAVETSLKIKVKRTALVSLLSGETVEVDL